MATQYGRKNSIVVGIRLPLEINRLLTKRASAEGLAPSVWARELIRRALAGEQGEIEPRELEVDDENWK